MGLPLRIWSTDINVPAISIRKYDVMEVHHVTASTTLLVNWPRTGRVGIAPLPPSPRITHPLGHTGGQPWIAMMPATLIIIHDT